MGWDETGYYNYSLINVNLETQNCVKILTTEKVAGFDL